MPRRAATTLVAVCAFAVAALVTTMALDERDLAFSLGVPSSGPAVEIPPASTGCQGPIPVTEEFELVELKIGTYFEPGPAADLAVLSHPDGKEVGTASLEAGYPDNKRHVLDVGSVPAGGEVDVCLRNRGPTKLAVYGSERYFSYASRAHVDGREGRFDMDLDFRRADGRSMLATVPDALTRAAMWLPGWLRSWLIWLVTITALVGTPALLVRAIGSAVRSS